MQMTGPYTPCIAALRENIGPWGLFTHYRSVNYGKCIAAEQMGEDMPEALPKVNVQAGYEVKVVHFPPDSPR